jgi:amino acid transporter
MKMADKQLSLFDLLCLGINAIVGSGIYLFPGLLAAAVGPASVLAFVICGLFSLLVGLSFAELSGRFERSGGPYIYAREAFGPVVGFAVGWTCWAAAVLSWAAVTRGLLLQVGHFNSAIAKGTPAIAIGIATVLLFSAINIRGVKPGAITTDLLTIVKLLPLVLLVLLAPFFSDVARFSPFAPNGFAELPDAVFTAFFAFQGFEVVPVPAGDAKDPRRQAPRAVIGSVFGATLLYALVQLAAVATTPGLAGSKQPLTLMAETLLGPIGGQLVALAAMLSMLGFCAGVALASPRYLEALSQDGFLPRQLHMRHASLQTPVAAISVNAAATAVLVFLLDFAQLVDLAVVFVAVQYLSTTAAVVVLRRKLGQELSPTSFRLPGGMLIPGLGFASVSWLVVDRLSGSENGHHIAVQLIAILLVGIIATMASRVWEAIRRS